MASTLNGSGRGGSGRDRGGNGRRGRAGSSSDSGGGTGGSGGGGNSSSSQFEYASRDNTRGRRQFEGHDAARPSRGMSRKRPRRRAVGGAGRATLPGGASETSAAAPAAPADLPGFTYDPIRKRYFRLARSGPTPAERPYTAESVRVKEARERHAGAHAENIRRAHRLSPPPLFWRRELGGISPRGSVCNIRRRYAYLLRRVGVVVPELFDTVVEDMHVHPERDEIFLGSNGGTRAGISVVQIKAGRGLFVARTKASMFSDNAPLTSLCLGPDETVLSTFLGRAGRSGSLHVSRYTQDAAEPFDDIFQFSPMQTSIWASTVRGNVVAIGASKQVIVVSGWDRPSPAVARMHTGSDVFSVALCPPSGHALLGGCRDGGVRLFDLRSPALWTPSRHGAVPGMKHSSPVYSVVALRDGWGVVSAALDGSISLWDLRASGRARAHQHEPAARAMPVMAFKETPDGFERCGMAIDEDETVLAAAGRDRRVRMYSLRSPRPFRTTEPLSGYCSALRWLCRPREYGSRQERGVGLLAAVHSEDGQGPETLEWWSL